MFLWQGIHTTRVMATPLCNGQSCENLNPNSMGCTGYTAGTVKYLPDGYSYTETRYASSSDCDAKWGRTKNNSGYNRYAAATIRYGCANYCYSKYVASPAAIASGEVVYTVMLALASTPTRTCGDISPTGPLSVPDSLSDTFCTGAN